MERNGFELDISSEQANRTHIKFLTAPDYPEQISPIEEAWREIKESKPNLRHEFARIATEYGGSDPELRAWVTKCMLTLYVVLKEANDSSRSASY